MTLARSSVLLALLGLASCTPEEPHVEYAKASTIERLGPQIEAAAAAGPEDLAGYFDWSALALRSLPADTPAHQRAELLRGARSGLEGESGMALVTQITQGTYTYRGVRWRDGRPVARFRYLPPDGGFNFHDLVLAYGERGVEPRIVDGFVLFSGEYFSDSMRRLASTLLGNTSLLGRLTGDRPASRHELDLLNELTRVSREGSPEEVLAAYDRLPERLQRDRSVLMMRATAASLLEDQDRYLAILDEIAEVMPNDPTLSVLMLDAHCVREQWEPCFADLAAIRAEYDDPYLDAFEGHLWVLRGDAERGLALADRAIAEEDDLLDAHDAALLAALALGRTERASLELGRLVDGWGIDAAALAEQEGYEGILALPAAGATPATE